MKKYSAAVMTVLLFFVMVFPAFAQTTIKIGHVLNQDHSWNVCLVGFADEVKSATEGRVLIEVYPGSQLGNEKDLIEGLSLQTIDGGLIGGGSFQSVEPKFGIEALPYAWPTHEAAYNALDGDLGAHLLALLEKQGIVGLSWENGFRHLTNNIRPIEKPEDLKGLKIRVTPDKMRLDTFRLSAPLPCPSISANSIRRSSREWWTGRRIPMRSSSPIFSRSRNTSLPQAISGFRPFLRKQFRLEQAFGPDRETVMKLAAKWRDEQRKQTIELEEEFLGKLREKGNGDRDGRQGCIPGSSPGSVGRIRGCFREGSYGSREEVREIALMNGENKRSGKGFG